MAKESSNPGAADGGAVSKEELQIELAGLEQRIEASFLQYRDDLMTKLDDIVGQLQDLRDEMALMNGRHKQLIEVEERIEKLEALHPHGQHSPV